MIFAFLLKTPFYDDIVAGKYSGGLYNGYVGFSGYLPESYQSSAGSIGYLDDLIDVHGGITFDSMIDFSGSWAVGNISITEVPVPSEGIYRVVGFDTLHWGDDMYTWNLERIKTETLSLLEQIVILIAKNEILKLQGI